jgi:hypothetical protein
MNNSKQHAIDDLTKKGDDALALGDRFNARKAYDFYNKAYSYDNSNNAIKSKSDQAFLMSQTHILIQAAPANMVTLPENFIRQALDKKWSQLESGWLKFHNSFQGNLVYHYYTDVLINSVVVTPERVAETSYVDTKKIEDGWEYAKNSDGSVKTDSAGNKIKQTVYRDITCTVRKFTMTKEATVNGTVTIYGIDSDRKYANDAILSTYTFKYEYATASGDSRALSTTSQGLVNKKAIEFPVNNELILNASTNFGNFIYDKVNQYKSSFQ